MKPKVRVVLYTKSKCTLCDKMKEQMSLADCEDLYALEEVDIEKDAEVYARYRYEIPVLSINDTEAFRYRLTADEFRAYITSIADA